MSKRNPSTIDTPAESFEDTPESQAYEEQVENVLGQAESALSDLAKAAAELNEILDKARVAVRKLQGQRPKRWGS